MNKKLFLLPLAALLLAGCTANGQQSKEQSKEQSGSGSQQSGLVANYEKVATPTNNMEVVLGVYKPDTKFNSGKENEFVGGYVYYNGFANTKDPWYFNVVESEIEEEAKTEGYISEELEAKVGKIKLEQNDNDTWGLLSGDKYIGLYKSGTHYSLTLGEDGAMATQEVDDFTFELVWDTANACFKATLGEGDDEKEVFIGSTGTFFSLSAFYVGKGGEQFGGFYTKKAA